MKADGKGSLLGDAEDEAPFLTYEWSNTQRKSNQIFITTDGLRGSMRADRIEALESIGVSWQALSKSQLEPRWERQFQRLLEFRQRYGHVNVPQRYEGGRPLGKWVNLQRRNYRRHQDPTERPSSRMIQDRIRQLDAVGFDWNASYHQEELDKQWDAKFQELLAFQKVYNTTRIPRPRYKHDPFFELRNWVKSVKQMHSNALKNITASKSFPVLTPERITRLESIGF